MVRTFFVITGATGSGKTALIHELKKRGYRCVEEVARSIIQEQTKINGDCVPWKNLSRFKELMLARYIESYSHALLQAQEVTFFDRDILDLIAYDRLTEAESSKELREAVSALLYNNKVFIVPPWKEIYHTDSERKQAYEEVIQVYDNLIRVYTEYGRELVKIPKMSVEKRADFVISHVKDWLSRPFPFN